MLLRKNVWAPDAPCVACNQALSHLDPIALLSVCLQLCGPVSHQLSGGKWKFPLKDGKIATFSGWARGAERKFP